MPGLEDGSSFENAFTWDHTMYPGGTRVFGATTNYGGGGNVQDWWALYLLANVPYVFQTRLPTAWDTILYLYSPEGYYVAAGFDGGDDGALLSKIAYTTPKEGWYRLSVWGYYYAGAFGSYVLESVPAPKSFRTFAFSPSRFSARAETAASVPSRFDAIPRRIAALQPARHDARARVERGIVSRLSARSEHRATVADRFDAIKTPAVVIVPGHFNSRANTNASAGARFSVRGLQAVRVPARFDIRSITRSAVPHRWSLYGRVVALFADRHDALVPSGWSVYARNTATNEALFLGFIPADADPKKLVDVPIPDGVHEIEVRPSKLFWREAHGRRVVTLVTDPPGGGAPVAGLPAIQNLHREIVGFQSLIKWSVAAEYAPGAFQFGLWFGSASPVDTSGPPAMTVPYVAGQGEYQGTRAQTGPEHVAVAAFTATARGEVAELALPWSSVPPGSPPNQIARAGV